MTFTWTCGLLGAFASSTSLSLLSVPFLEDLWMTLILHAMIAFFLDASANLP